MFKGQRYLVVGSGISGIGAARLLEQLGADFILYDSNEKVTAEELTSILSGESKVKCIAGSLPQEVEDSITKVVLSPGVPTDMPLIQRLRSRGVGILGEIELGFSIEKGSVIGITGTNGKTTTTKLVGDIMKAHLGEQNVFVVGNIGNPYTMEALKTTKDTVTVAEISSFQLETIHTFQPSVSAILNITPDHLDRHHTMEEYVKVKETIALNQTIEDKCILNYDNEYTRCFGTECLGQVIYFSSKKILENGFFLHNNKICKGIDGEIKPLMDIHTGMKLVGIGNVENVMAAIAMTEAMGVPMQTILSTIQEFPPVEHRIEFVATKKGVDYYNDSKATNPDAAIQGIQAMSKPTILIGGGYDKENEYENWINSFDGKVKWLVLVGKTREKIAVCARKNGFMNIRFTDTFEQCLAMCTDLAKEGDAVLLSPACASWGEFPNYEVRGQVFKEYVINLKE